jgi:hypothetical protein
MILNYLPTNGQYLYLQSNNKNFIPDHITATYTKFAFPPTLTNALIDEKFFSIILFNLYTNSINCNYWMHCNYSVCSNSEFYVLTHDLYRILSIRAFNATNDQSKFFSTFVKSSQVMKNLKTKRLYVVQKGTLWTEL